MYNNLNNGAIDLHERRFAMLNALNKSLKVFTAQKDQPVSEVMTGGLTPIAEAVEVDCICIYYFTDDAPDKSLRQIYRWAKADGGTTTVDDRPRIISDDPDIVRRIESLYAGECVTIRSPMNGHEAECVSPVKIRLAAPVFILDKLWGIVVFENFTDRHFDDESISFLQSASGLCANFIIEAEKEDLAKLMMDTNPLCCQVWNAGLNVIDCNEAAVRLYGFKDKQEYLDRLAELSPEYQPDGQLSKEKIVACLKKAFADGKCTVEWTHRMTDGMLIPTEISLIRIKYKDNYLVAGYTRDLREEKAMLAEIRERDDLLEYNMMRYQLTNAALNVALWDTNIVGDVMTTDTTFIWSDEFRHILGFSDETDFPNKLSSWSSRLHPEDYERVMSAFKSHVNDRSGKTPYDIEYRFLTKSGDYRHFRAFGSTLRDSEGTPLRVAGAMEDVTDKKLMHEKIVERGNLLDAVNRAASTLLSIKNEDNFETALVESMEIIGNAVNSDRVQLWRNATIDGLLYFVHHYEWLSDFGKKCVKVPFGLRFPYKDMPGWENKFRRGEYINAPFSGLPTSDKGLLGDYEIKTVIIIPLFVQDYFWGFFSIDDCREERIFSEEEISLLTSASLMMVNAINRNNMTLDIRSAAAKLETALIEAQQANYAKSEFLSRMSHEMRTPMNAIIGMNMIGRNAADIERKDYAFDKISTASAHLLGIINDTLDLSKIEANKLELSDVEFDFKEMMQKAVSLTHIRMEEKKQRFSMNIDERIPVNIIGDDQRLAQVITNLLSNAVKFTPEEGQISLSAFLTEEKDGICELRIEVADSGIGIAPDQKEKIFFDFEQADGGISRKFGGTGLGLAISKRIIEHMNGTIHVESELGKGARFIFTVKLKRGLKDGDTNGDISPHNTVRYTGRKLLLAEDIEINREILLSLLDGTGLIIDVAENGRKAFEMVKADPDLYDLVFMDVQMPEMDGFEATRRIRALPVTRSKKLPVIAMTANVYNEDIKNCISAGMDDHVGKPLDINELFEKLNKYL